MRGGPAAVFVKAMDAPAISVSGNQVVLGGNEGEQGQEGETPVRIAPEFTGQIVLHYHQGSLKKVDKLTFESYKVGKGVGDGRLPAADSGSSGRRKI